MKPHCKNHKRFAKTCYLCLNWVSIERAKKALEKLKVGEAGSERVEMGVRK